MFGLFTFSLTHFLAKIIFPGGMGGVQNSSGNSKGVGGGYFSGQKLEITGRRRGGAYVKFPPWWGYGYFLELHNGKAKELIRSKKMTIHSTSYHYFQAPLRQLLFL